MAGHCSYHAVPGEFRRHLYGVLGVAQSRPRPYLRDAVIETPARHVDKTLFFGAYLSHRVRPRGVGVVSVQFEDDVHAHDLAFGKDFERGDAVHDHVVHRYAGRGGIAVIAFAGSGGAERKYLLLYFGVEFQRGYAGRDERVYGAEHFDKRFARGTHLRDLFIVPYGNHPRTFLTSANTSSGVPMPSTSNSLP